MDDEPTARAQTMGLDFELGEGINPMIDFPDSPATGKICVEPNYSVTALNERYYRGFYSYQKDEFEVKLEANGGIEVPILEYELDLAIGAHLDAAYSATNLQTMVHFIGHIKTVRRSITVTGDVNDSWCSTNNPARPASFAQFISDCGTKYVRAQDMGGYVILSASLEMLDDETKLAISANTNVNVFGNALSANLDGAMQLLASTNIEQQGVFITTWGIQAPDVSLYDSNGMFPPSSWPQYMQQLENSYTADAANQVLDAPGYGRTIKNAYNHYTAGDLSLCGVLPYQQQFECFQKLYSTIERFNERFAHDFAS